MLTAPKCARIGAVRRAGWFGWLRQIRRGCAQPRSGRHCAGASWAADDTVGSGERKKQGKSVSNHSSASRWSWRTEDGSSRRPLTDTLASRPKCQQSIDLFRPQGRTGGGKFTDHRCRPRPRRCRRCAPASVSERRTSSRQRPNARCDRTASTPCWLRPELGVPRASP